jgi:hypothetical protein
MARPISVLEHHHHHQWLYSLCKDLGHLTPEVFLIYFNTL